MNEEFEYQWNTETGLTYKLGILFGNRESDKLSIYRVSLIADRRVIWYFDLDSTDIEDLRRESSSGEDLAASVIADVNKKGFVLGEQHETEIANRIRNLLQSSLLNVPSVSGEFSESINLIPFYQALAWRMGEDWQDNCRTITQANLAQYYDAALARVIYRQTLKSPDVEQGPAGVLILKHKGAD